MRLSSKDSAKGQTDGIIALLDMIIEDLNNELAESKAAEEAAQLDYEKMKKAVEEQKAKLTKSKINLEGQIAEEETAKTAESDLKKENEKELKNEETTEEDLKKAREFLAGMEADAFVQAPTHASVFPSFQS